MHNRATGWLLRPQNENGNADAPWRKNITVNITQPAVAEDKSRILKCHASVVEYMYGVNCEWRINRQPSSTLLLRYIAFQYPSSTPLYLNECVKQFEGAKVGDHISTFMFKWLLRFNYHHPFLLWIAGMFYCNATFSWGLLFPGSHPGFPSSSTSTFGTGIAWQMGSGKHGADYVCWEVSGDFIVYVVGDWGWNWKEWLGWWWWWWTVW